MKHIIGKFEKVSFPEFGINNVVAKIDTGAYSGALHCTKIKELKTNKGMVLQFSPFDHPEVEIKTSQYEVGGVRSSNGISEHRYYIKTTIRIGTHQYPITITLSNRSSMRYPVLLGRKFLMQSNFLVDVGQDNR